MTHKERFWEAVHFRQPCDHVASMELEFQIAEEYVGRELVLGDSFIKLSAKEKEKIHHENALTMLMVLENAGLDAVKEMGGYWEVAPGHPAYMWLPTMEDRLAYVRAFQQESSGQYYMLGNVGDTLAIPDGNQIYELVEQLYDEPKTVHRKCENMLCQALQDEEQLMAAGCDGIINAADIAFNTATFMSTSMLDEFFFPYFARWVEKTKQLGGLTVWHTDGNISAVLDRAVEAGVEAIQCIDPLGGMNIVALKKAWYQKVALIGNIDCALLQNGTRPEIDEAVRNVVEGCKEGGGFVLSGCNAIFKGIPAEHYQWMVDAKNHYGKDVVPHA